MAKDKLEPNDTAATSTPGTWMPDEFLKAMGDGFSQIETILLGDPNDKEGGKVPVYCGVLLGPGAPITRDDPRTGESREQPTWSFHPITRMGPVENVTHVVPASYQVHAACQRVWDTAQKNDQVPVVGIVYMEQGKTRQGFRINRFRIFERYFLKSEAIRVGVGRQLNAAS